MIRIAITPAAFDAIAKTMPFGSVGYDVDVIGSQRYVWLAPNVVDRLRFLRGPGESYSDVILRLASENVAKGLADSLDLSRIYESAFLQLVANHVSPISEIIPRRESAA